MWPPSVTRRSPPHFRDRLQPSPNASQQGSLLRCLYSARMPRVHPSNCLNTHGCHPFPSARPSFQRHMRSLGLALSEAQLCGTLLICSYYCSSVGVEMWLTALAKVRRFIDTPFWACLTSNSINVSTMCLVFWVRTGTLVVVSNLTKLHTISFTTKIPNTTLRSAIPVSLVRRL